MVFSSLTFLLIFLPAVLLIYWCTPKKLKNFVLFLFSMLFYAWGEPVYVWMMAASVLWNYIFGRAIAFEAGNGNRRVKKGLLVLAVAGNLFLLAVMKYMDFLISGVNFVFAARIPALKIALPIGISFYTFQTLSYLIDVYRGKVQVQKNVISFGTYVSLFPQLIAGPIVRYDEVEKELQNREIRAEEIASGIKRFVLGLAKKVLIANQAGQIWEEISAVEAGGLPMSLAWLGAVCFMLQIYYDFSGYSDMAIGLGKMLGFHFPENFNFPYLARSATDFWHRWHISLSSWFREYLYIPLGGNRVSAGKHIRNLFIVWLLTGLWHGASWNFILWGLYYAVLLIGEKYLYGKVLEKMPGILQHFYGCIVVLFGWVLFSHTSLSELLIYLNSMTGGFGFLSTQAWYLFRTHAALLGIAVLGAFGLWSRLLNWCKKQRFWESISVVLYPCGMMAVLLITMAFLLRDSYNPFLYFRF